MADSKKRVAQEHDISLAGSKRQKIDALADCDLITTDGAKLRCHRVDLIREFQIYQNVDIGGTIAIDGDRETVQYILHIISKPRDPILQPERNLLLKAWKLLFKCKSETLLPTMRVFYRKQQTELFQLTKDEYDAFIEMKEDLLIAAECYMIAKRVTIPQHQLAGEFWLAIFRLDFAKYGASILIDRVISKTSIPLIYKHKLVDHFTQLGRGSQPTGFAQYKDNEYVKTFMADMVISRFG